MPCIILRNELALSAFTLVSASTIASCVSGLPHVTSKFGDEEKENFLALVEWLPVTSRSHTHTRTHKCKISIPGGNDGTSVSAFSSEPLRAKLQDN